MKIHILPTGFTSEVFTDSAGAIVKQGADRIISIHTRYGSRQEKELVEKTIKSMEQSLKTEIERREIDKGDIEELIQSMISLLGEFDEKDELFLHLVGGERHLCTALLYASFFAGRGSTLIVATEYGFDKGKEFRFDYLPSIMPRKPTAAQMKVLSVILEKDSVGLSDIVKRMGGKYSSLAPSLLRHLKNIKALGLVRYDPIEKEYYATALARFFYSKKADD